MTSPCASPGKKTTTFKHHTKKDPTPCVRTMHETNLPSSVDLATSGTLRARQIGHKWHAHKHTGVTEVMVDGCARDGNDDVGGARARSRRFQLYAR